TSSAGAGGAAQAAESRKSTKYQELVASGNFLFSPVAIETLGTWGPSVIVLCQDLEGRIAQVTGDSRSLAFRKQRLSLESNGEMPPPFLAHCPSPWSLKT